VTAAPARIVAFPASAGLSRASLAVTRLDLVDFRSYRELHMQVPAGPVALVGPNGAGKTNLLEA